MGSIELTIADEAYNVAIRVAYGNGKIAVLSSYLQAAEM